MKATEAANTVVRGRHALTLENAEKEKKVAGCRIFFSLFCWHLSENLKTHPQVAI